MNIHDALGKITARDDLSREEMRDVMGQLMRGQMTDAQIGGFLVALRIKGESRQEVAGAAEVMRALAEPVAVDVPHLVDTCGTGGDGADIFNVSTASAFVAAAAGARVAKHGNRSVSSATGSADVLEKAGVDLSVSPALVSRAIEQIGIGFMFAPAHHGAMKHAIGPRRELGMRTIFNMLGPLTNPAGVRRQVLGVYDRALCRTMAEVLLDLGSVHAMVVHAEDGLDEISIAAPTHVVELRDGDIKEFELRPDTHNLAYTDLSGLEVKSAEESLTLIRRVFSGERDDICRKAASIITLNAAAAIYVAGVARTLSDAVAMAEDAIVSGGAKTKLQELVEFTCAVA